MKIIASVFILCSIAFITNAQNLSLDKLMEFKKQDINQVESYMEKNNWRYLASKKESDGISPDSCTTAYWTLNEVSEGYYNVPTVFGFSYSELISNWYIFYATYNIDNYKNIISSLSNYSFIKEKTLPLENSINKFYSNEKLNLGALVTEKTGEHDKQMYSIALFDYFYFQAFILGNFDKAVNADDTK